MIANLVSQTYSSSNQLNKPLVSESHAPEASAEVSINRILECAIVLSWKDYMPPQAGLIHIAYSSKTDRSLAYAKIWSSLVRGYWNLVCQYFVEPAPFVATGLSVEKISASSTLAQMLTAVMQNQGQFTKSAEAGKNVVVQVYPPSAADILLAETDWARSMPRIPNEVSGAQENSANWENEGGKLVA